MKHAPIILIAEPLNRHMEENAGKRTPYLLSRLAIVDTSRRVDARSSRNTRMARLLSLRGIRGRRALRKIGPTLMARNGG